MGTKIKPGQFDCYGAALPDEPMFILLARDPDAAEAVRWWVTLRQARIGRGEKPLEDHALLAEALSCAAAMVSWRDEASDPHTYGTTPRWKLPQAGTPMGGAEVDWPTLQAQTYVWEFGNRFRMWEALGDYWFAEWTEDEDSGQWSGAYPLQRNLQKEMLIAAYNDHRAAVQHKVEAVKSLLPLPHYSDIVTMLREIGCAALDCKAGEVDQVVLDQAEEKLRRFLWENAEDFANGVEVITEHPPCQSLATPSVATSDDQPKMLSRTRIEELLDYATDYGEMSEDTPDGTPSNFGGTPMNEPRRVAIWCYKRILGLIPEDRVYIAPAAPSVATSALKDAEDLYASLTDKDRLMSPGARKRNSREVHMAAKLVRALGGNPPKPDWGDEDKKAESDLIDVTDTPELPPHRFTIFTKSKHWGYGRGLEINPSHIPDMLDRMMEDGYYLQAVFGGTEANKVGMLFKRLSKGGKVKAGSIVVHHDPASPPSGGIPPAVAGMMAQRNRYKA